MKSQKVRIAMKSQKVREILGVYDQIEEHLSKCGSRVGPMSTPFYDSSVSMAAYMTCQLFSGVFATQEVFTGNKGAIEELEQKLTEREGLAKELREANQEITDFKDRLDQIQKAAREELQKAAMRPNPSMEHINLQKRTVSELLDIIKDLMGDMYAYLAIEEGIDRRTLHKKDLVNKVMELRHKPQ